MQRFQMIDNTAHELGHVLNERSLKAWSGNATYTGTYIKDDKKQLNEDSGLGTYDHGAGKEPCSKTDKAPFDGQTGFTGSVINDVKNEAVCNESTGKLNSGSSGSTNYEIAENASTGIIGSANSAEELFAEAFGWAAYGSTLSNPLYGSGFSTSSYFQQTTDGLFANGYFGCTRAWANDALTGTLTLPSYCK